MLSSALSTMKLTISVGERESSVASIQCQSDPLHAWSTASKGDVLVSLELFTDGNVKNRLER